MALWLRTHGGRFGPAPSDLTPPCRPGKWWVRPLLGSGAQVLWSCSCQTLGSFCLFPASAPEATRATRQSRLLNVSLGSIRLAPASGFGWVVTTSRQAGGCLPHLCRPGWGLTVPRGLSPPWVLLFNDEDFPPFPPNQNAGQCQGPHGFPTSPGPARHKWARALLCLLTLEAPEGHL